MPVTVRSHKVAHAAYTVVARRAGSSASQCKKYGAIAHKLPGMILQNGLAQTTGFLLAKGKDEHLDVLDDLRSILCETQVTHAADRQALHADVIAADMRRTMLLTRRSLDAAGWMKRYVQGLLRVSATGDPQGQEDQGNEPAEGE